jgi:phage gp45-like
MLKLAKVTKSNGTGKVASEASGQGRAGLTYLQMGQYGIISRPPLNSLTVLLPINGDESNVIGLTDLTDQGQMPSLEEGECAIGAYKSGSYIHFKNDGTIFIKGNIVHIGDTNQTGNVNIAGTLATTGNMTSSAAVISMTATIGGKVFATHTHNGVTTGSGVTGVVA